MSMATVATRAPCYPHQTFSGPGLNRRLAPYHRAESCPRSRACPPKLACDLERVDAGGLPPCALVAGTMDRAVMHSAQRDSEFVARFAAERAWLHVPKMMGV